MILRIGMVLVECTYTWDGCSLEDESLQVTVTLVVVVVLFVQIFHPNIDAQGNVCLNILREDWKPVLSLSSVIYGLLHLFLVSSLYTSTVDQHANTPAYIRR